MKVCFVVLAVVSLTCLSFGQGGWVTLGPQDSQNSTGGYLQFGGVAGPGTSPWVASDNSSATVTVPSDDWRSAPQFCSKDLGSGDGFCVDKLVDEELATIKAVQDNLDQAQKLYDDTVRLIRAAHGDSNPNNVYWTGTNLAICNDTTITVEIKAGYAMVTKQIYNKCDTFLLQIN